MIKKKVFLGGTCANSRWREELIPQLKCDYFNPVVEDWTPECQEEELKQRRLCDYVLYVITPEMEGLYSIAELTEDAVKQPEKTVICFLNRITNPQSNKQVWDKGALKSIAAITEMAKENGAKCFNDLESVARFLNG